MTATRQESLVHGCAKTADKTPKRDPTMNETTTSKTDDNQGSDQDAKRSWKAGGPPHDEQDRKPMRPGDGLDWDGSVKDENVPHHANNDKKMDIIEYCERCGKAGSDVHNMVGIGRNRDPVCEDCGTKTIRQTTVSSLSEEVRE